MLFEVLVTVQANSLEIDGWVLEVVQFGVLAQVLLEVLTVWSRSVC